MRSTAVRLYLEYAVAGEQHDRELPGSFSQNGYVWIPAPGWPASQSLAFWIAQREAMNRRAAQFGVDQDALRDAEESVSRMPYRQQREELERLRRSMGETSADAVVLP